MLGLGTDVRRVHAVGAAVSGYRFVAVTPKGRELFVRRGTSRYYERVRMHDTTPDDRPNTVRDLRCYVDVGNFACDADAIDFVDRWLP